MGHFGAMSDLREISGGTSGATGIYADDLNRSIPPLPQLSHGPSPNAHFSSSSSTAPMHAVTSSQGSSGIEERLSETEKMVQKRDKDAIYS